MIPSDICPGCKTSNKKTWYLIKSKSGKFIKLCRKCKDSYDSNPLDMSYYEKAKKRLERERRANNNAIIRDLKGIC